MRRNQSHSRTAPLTGCWEKGVAHGRTVSPPNRDKLTMRSKPLKLLYLILSLSKDGAKIFAFFSILLKRTLEISLPASAFYQMEQLLIVH